MAHSAPAPGPRSPRRLGAALATTAAVVASMMTGTVTQAAPAAAAGAPVVTRAALAPELVTGRGANVGFLEQEAENAVTDGTVIGPDRTAYTLPAEASGRTAVRLTPGQHLELTLPAATNAINVRYSLPDAPDGGGITAPLSVTVGGKHATSMTLTSRYSWLYNQYQFSNDPNADPIHPDWWMVERDGGEFATGITKPFRPMHFYDEQRLLLGKTYAAGDKLRLTATAGAAWTVIDLVDTELVAKPAAKPRNAVSVLDFGADPTGASDAAPAIEAAIAAAKSRGKTVFIPKGTYQVNRHIVVDDVTIQGAGNWHTIITGKQVTLDAPLPDQSIHTGVGFYGKYVEAGGSNNVHLSDFAIEGDVRERVDTDQVNGIGGAMSNSTIDGLYIQHTKVGLWFDGPMTNTHVTDSIVVDQIADGINFRRGVANSSAVNNFFRNTGDDAMAMWSDVDADVANTFGHNTVQTPTLANGIAIYGGTDNAVSSNLVADPIREGSGLHAGSRFGARPFTGVLTFADNTVVRAGTYELNWNIGLGAIWIYALESSISGIEVTGDHYLDSTYNAIMFVADWPVKDLYSITNVSFDDVRVDGTGTSVVNARAMGAASFENVDARNVGAPVPWGDSRELFVNNCGSFTWDWVNGSTFHLGDLGGNDYFGDPTQTTWLPGWLFPAPGQDLITCNDRPPVNPPPPPSAW
jgi:Alpha-1,3-glucanase catalytic domain D1/Alpha-1,3-glucanase catalytic domain D2